jgi:hypothetical protein
MRHENLYQCLKILSTQLSINTLRSCQTLYSLIKEFNRSQLSFAAVHKTTKELVVSFNGVEDTKTFSLNILLRNIRGSPSNAH